MGKRGGLKEHCYSPRGLWVLASYLQAEVKRRSNRQEDKWGGTLKTLNINVFLKLSHNTTYPVNLTPWRNHPYTLDLCFHSKWKWSMEFMTNIFLQPAFMRPCKNVVYLLALSFILNLSSSTRTKTSTQAIFFFLTLTRRLPAIAKELISHSKVYDKMLASSTHLETQNWIMLSYVFYKYLQFTPELVKSNIKSATFQNSAWT